MATLTKVSSTVVSVSGISNGRQVRQRFSLKRQGQAYRKLAEEFYEKLLIENMGSTPVLKERIQKRMTVEELCDKYYDEHMSHTRANNKSYLNLIKAKWGKWRLNLITIEQVRPWIWEQFKTYKGPTVKKIARYFQRVFNWGKEMSLLSSNPLDDLIDMRLKKQFARTCEGRRVYVTHEQLFVALEQIEAKNKATKSKYNDSVVWLTNIARFAAWTGMRLGEIVSLKWSSVHVSEVVIAASDTKEGYGKLVALEPMCVSMLDALRKKATTEWVFDGINGGRLNENKVSKSWQWWAKEVKLDLRFHDIRHIYAKRKRLEGHDIKAIAAQMGHQSLAMNMVYDHATEEDVRRLSCPGTNG